MSPRYALVTGAGGGIGAATALALAAEGYSLWITYATSEAGAHVIADQCSLAGAPEVHVTRLDLRDPQSISYLAANVSGVWGQLHVLVNNGAVCHYRPFEEIGIDEVIRFSGLPSSAASVALLSLEMKRLVKQLPGKMFVRNR